MEENYSACTPFLFSYIKCSQSYFFTEKDHGKECISKHTQDLMLIRKSSTAITLNQHACLL